MLQLRRASQTCRMLHCLRASPLTLRNRPNCMRPSCFRWWLSRSAWYMVAMHSGKDWRATAGMSAAGGRARKGQQESEFEEW